MEIKVGTLVDLAAVLLLTASAICRPRDSDGFFVGIERAGRRIARHRTLCCIGVGLLTLAVRAALLPVWHIPRPSVQDEFAYLLGADTFASGRLTNPTPPLWQFFESTHIILVPTYASKFPPAQSLFLALGQVVFGHPWFGVWLSCGVMIAAICWMLQGWLPSGWALLGALLALIRAGVGSYWMNSYWGGAVAAIGGCLVLGAYVRIVRRRQFAYAWVLGAGLLILANSRPFEGTILAVPVILALIHRLITSAAGRRRLPLGPIVVPLLVCLVCGAGAMGYYNYRVTGHPLRMPYREHVEQYGTVPVLFFMPFQPPRTYRHDSLRFQYVEWEMTQIRQAREHFLTVRASELWTTNEALLGLALVAPLALLPLTFRDQRTRLLLIVLLAMLCATALAQGIRAHYLAPATGCLFGLLIQCLRHLRASRFLDRNTGRYVVTMLPVLAATAFLITLAIALHTERPVDPLSTVKQKPEVEARLLATGGKQLVFVHYHLTTVAPFDEWVSNRADIDASPVVWAQDMGPIENRKLLSYYADRHAWLFEPNATPPRLTPCPR